MEVTEEIKWTWTQTNLKIKYWLTDFFQVKKILTTHRSDRRLVSRLKNSQNSILRAQMTQPEMGNGQINLDTWQKKAHKGAINVWGAQCQQTSGKCRSKLQRNTPPRMATVRKSGHTKYWRWHRGNGLLCSSEGTHSGAAPRKGSALSWTVTQTHLRATIPHTWMVTAPSFVIFRK